MTGFGGILDLQVQSVLDVLRAERDRRCREIRHAAAGRAEQLLADSRRRMRERVHRAVVEERQRRETSLLDARHRIETARRKAVQALYRDFLQEALPLLHAELERRWRDAAARRDWCAMVIGEASDRLPDVRWTLEHPADWTPDDAQRLAQDFADRGLPQPGFREDAAITAGLRIRLATACLDATLEGLLANRPAVEARLLAAWERQQCREEEAND
jgi:hypothetical protein